MDCGSNAANGWMPLLWGDCLKGNGQGGVGANQRCSDCHQLPQWCVGRSGLPADGRLLLMRVDICKGGEKRGVWCAILLIVLHLRCFLVHKLDPFSNQGFCLQCLSLAHGVRHYFGYDNSLDLLVKPFARLMVELDELLDNQSQRQSPRDAFSHPLD